jgi:alkylhydroperoxidase family enzyme
MSEARIAPLSIDAATEAAKEAGCPEGLAKLSVFQILLRKPQAARALNGMLTALLFKGELDPGIRELIIMRIAWVRGAGYEWAHHWDFALRVGHDEKKIVGLRDWQGADEFTAPERAALAATDDTLRSGLISDDTWHACAVHFDEDLLVELVAVIANWQLFATLLVNLRIPLEEDRTSWPPDGVAPDAAN